MRMFAARLIIIAVFALLSTGASGFEYGVKVSVKGLDERAIQGMYVFVKVRSAASVLNTRRTDSRGIAEWRFSGNGQTQKIEVTLRKSPDFAKPAIYSQTQDVSPGDNDVQITLDDSAPVAGSKAASTKSQRVRPSKDLELQVLAFNLAGTSVAVDRDLAEASAEDEWGSSLQGTVPFIVLLRREAESTNLIEHLETGRKEVTAWIDELSTTGDVISVKELKACPYFFRTIVGSGLFGHLRRRAVPKLPLSLDQVRKHEPIFPLETYQENSSLESFRNRKIGGGWILHMGRRATRFPISSDFSQSESDWQYLFAESLSRGVRENIVSGLSLFANRAADELLRLTKLRDVVRTVIAKESSIQLRVAVTNTGSTARVVAPHAVAIIQAGTDRTQFVLETSNVSVDVTLRSSDTIGGEADEDNPSPSRTIDSSFLRGPGNGAYISIPPKETRLVTFQQANRLGIHGNGLIQKLRGEEISVRVVAFDSDGRPLSTSSASFSNGPNKAMQTELLEKALASQSR